jgi:hypothetical protein
MEFKKAVKAKQKLRLAIDGVAGSGKTYTALAIATGMADKIPLADGMRDKIAVIDTEHGSASLYADRFEFEALDLDDFQIETYIEALNTAAAEKFPIVIIDSTSHAWDALVERVERIALQKFGGNTFRAWGEGTPLQKKLIEAMLNYPGHVIVTCRSKTEYSVDKDDKGKTTVKKVGTAAVQRQGFEYEFTMAMTMDANHVGLITKDRTSKFQDKFIEKPGREFGHKLIEWLNEGAAPPPPPPKTIADQCHDGMVEIGNVLTGLVDGKKIFTDDEMKAVKSKLAAFPKDPPEARLNFINKLLDEQKEILQNRLSFLQETATPFAPKAPPPVQAPPTSPPTTSPESPSLPLAGSAGETVRSAQTTSERTVTSVVTSSDNPVPPMYRELEPDDDSEGDEVLPEEEQGRPTMEDDGFEDDIPEETPPEKGGRKGKKSTVPSSDELDIY